MDHLLPYLANCSLLFTEEPLLRRPAAARAAGFAAVEFWWPFATAVPADRIKILRDAFNRAVKDPQFVAEAAKLRLPVSPKTGEEALKVVEKIYATPEDIVQAARKVAGE